MEEKNVKKSIEKIDCSGIGCGYDCASECIKCCGTKKLQEYPAMIGSKHL